MEALDKNPHPDATDYAIVLMRQGGGQTNKAATEALREVVKAVRETGKSGAVTIRLDVKLVEQTTQIVISDKITSKVPQLDRQASIYFTTPEGDVLRDNPDQDPLFNVQEIERTAARIIDYVTGQPIDPTTGEILDH